MAFANWASPVVTDLPFFFCLIAPLFCWNSLWNFSFIVCKIHFKFHCQFQEAIPAAFGPWDPICILAMHHMIIHVPAKGLQPPILLPAATFYAVRLSRLCKNRGRGTDLNWVKLPGKGPSWTKRAKTERNSDRMIIREFCNYPQIIQLL